MSGGLETLSACQVAEWMRVPGSTDDKYTRGVVQLATGSSTYPGAAVLSVAGAFGCGPGMVRYSGVRTPSQLVISRFPEVVLNRGHFNCAVLGSGWDQDRLVVAEQIISDATSGGQRVPVVVDAGALSYSPQWAPHSSLILTPHLGEASRLWSQLQKSLGSNGGREPVGAEMAHYLAEHVGAIVVLKSSTTWVADCFGVQSVFRSSNGWAGTAGSGDVLAGTIGGFVAANYRSGFADNVNAEQQHTMPSLTQAVSAAVWIHGTAAHRAATPPGPICASEIADHIPKVFREVLGQRRECSVSAIMDGCM